MLIEIAKHLSDNNKENESSFVYRMALCFDPQNSEALFHFGLRGVANSIPETGAALIKRACQVAGTAAFPLQPILDIVAKRYQESIKACLVEDHERAKRDLENFVTLTNTMPDKPIFYVATAMLAEALRYRDLALDWCLKGLQVPANLEANLLLVKAGLRLISVAIVNDDLINALANRATAAIQAGHGVDQYYFVLLYKKYWDGDDLGSQRDANEFRKILGDQGFLGNNLMNSWHLCRYDDQFFSSIGSYESISDTIGPLTHEKILPQGQGPIILISCDSRYLEILGTKLLESAGIVGTLGNVHLHVINATDESRQIVSDIETRFDVALGFSSERLISVHKNSIIHNGNSFLKTYYASARFIRMVEFSELYNRPIAQIDTDCLLVTDITKLPICSHDMDVGFLFDGIKSGPARQFNATFFFLNTHERSREYAKLLARYIAHFIAFDIPFWGLDQAALYCVYRYMERHGSAPTANCVPSWELFNHLFPSSADDMDDKIRRLDRRLDLLRAGS